MSDTLSKKLYFSTPLEEYDLAANLSLENVLMSAFPAYKTNKFDNIKELFSDCNLCYDSGGFQILMNPEKFDSVDPYKTLEVYERLQYGPDDLLIQLDLPTDFYDSLEKRQEWITKSALFYHQMKEQNKQVIPVVHGWTKKELEYSLESVSNPETISFGSYIATETRGTKAAIGSYGATQRVKPGVGNQYVGIGAYAAKEVPQITKAAVSSGSAEERQKFTPANIIYSRFGIAMSLLKKKGIDNILALGAGGLNMMHLAFAAGARMVDGSSWRIASRFFSIFVPEKAHRSFSTKRRTSTPFGKEDDKILRELHKESDYPFSDLGYQELLDSLAADKKLGFVTRAVHNAFVLQWEIKNIANKYANDPEGYWDYLINKRWEKSHHWRKRALLVQKALTDDFVQTDMRAYLKMDQQFCRMLTKDVKT